MNRSDNKSNEQDSGEIAFEYYKMLVETSKDCFWIFDYTNHRFKYISPSVYQLFGLTIEDAMMANLENSFSKTSLKKIKENIIPGATIFIDGVDKYKSSTTEIEQFSKDGTIKTVEITTRIVTNKKTNCVEIIGVTKDITLQKYYEKELYNKLEKSKDLLQNLGEDGDGNVPCGLRVCFFKKFTVYGIDGKPIKWRTRKTEELFAFFLHNKELNISKTEIFDALWPDISPDKATTYLHTSLYNVKKNLLSAGIEIKINYRNGYYSCEMPLYYSDVQEFIKMYSTTLFSVSGLNDFSVEKLEKIVSIYIGDYLSGNDYLWALSESALRRRQFESAAFTLASYYVSLKKYADGKNLLIKLIDCDNLNENFYELLFEIYLHTKEYVSFERHYINLKHLLEIELNAKPQDSIQILYRKMLDEVNGMKISWDTEVK